jgi:hypothetical protein
VRGECKDSHTDLDARVSAPNLRARALEQRAWFCQRGCAGVVVAASKDNSVFINNITNILL